MVSVSAKAIVTRKGEATEVTQNIGYQKLLDVTQFFDETEISRKCQMKNLSSIQQWLT
jgi:hypothetical protein